MQQNQNLTGRTAAHDDDSKGHGLVDDAKQMASNAADQVREQASAKITSGKDKAVETIGDVAKAVRQTGETMKDGPIPDLADRAADGIESVAEYFKTRNVGDIVREVERFARREPAIFLGASFAIGLLGGRFLKSSSKKTANKSMDLHTQGYAYRPVGMAPPPPPRIAAPQPRTDMMRPGMSTNTPSASSASSSASSSTSSSTASSNTGKLTAKPTTTTATGTSPTTTTPGVGAGALGPAMKPATPKPPGDTGTGGGMGRV